MRKRLAKGVLWVLAVLVVVAVGAVYFISWRHMERTYDVKPAALLLPADPAAATRGARLAIVRGCVDCHGDDLGGKVFIDDPMIGHFAGRNLTRGEGGVGTLTTVQYELAIRHGIRPDHHSLIFMPSTDFWGMNDADLGDLIVYIKSLPPVNRQVPLSSPGPLGRLLYLKRDFPLLPAEAVDQTAPWPAPVLPGQTSAYGKYLAESCTGCHGPHLSGGHIPGTPPAWPPAANLTPDASGLKGWSEADFQRLLRTGVRPDGSAVSAVMPWNDLSHLTDTEIGAIWLYLSALPPRPAGHR